MQERRAVDRSGLLRGSVKMAAQLVPYSETMWRIMWYTITARTFDWSCDTAYHMTGHMIHQYSETMWYTITARTFDWSCVLVYNVAGHMTYYVINFKLLCDNVIDLPVACSHIYLTLPLTHDKARSMFLKGDQLTATTDVFTSVCLASQVSIHCPVKGTKSLNSEISILVLLSIGQMAGSNVILSTNSNFEPCHRKSLSSVLQCII